MPDSIEIDTATADEDDSWAVAVHPGPTGVEALVYPMVGDDAVDAAHPVPCTVVFA